MSGQKEKIIIDFLKLPREEAMDVGEKGGIAADEKSKKPRIPRFSLGVKVKEEALTEANKDIFKKQHSHEKKLNELVGKSSTILARIRNIIPIFTDEIIIDASKVTIINRPFFFSEHIQAISIKNINDIFIETVPFLATISIMDVGLPKSHMIHVKWFWKKDAEKARRLITGLMETSKENVDLINLDGENLKEKLSELGKVRVAHTTVSGA